MKNDNNGKDDDAAVTTTTQTYPLKPVVDLLSQNCCFDGRVDNWSFSMIQSSPYPLVSSCCKKGLLYLNPNNYSRMDTNQESKPLNGQQV